ncbi:Subtilisin-like protease SDD1 [Acorus calamus]|uniref:Subtilisin-like protease SDD1 n=1 Tax=Acorus calamus TaxID=4465 RepID=A0AAV9DWS8_ACOCL|nr:Subtilisin-like protease SDD1 [Acorus calamus]
MPEERVLSDSESIDDYYRSFLPTVTDTLEDSLVPTMVYSYGQVVSGFAARLTANHVSLMSEKIGFIKAYPDRLIPLHTTRTPSFLGLDIANGIWNVSNSGKDVIIGVLDTGAIPTHPSFKDDGMDPPPTTWKGTCEYASSSSCNNKIIGAKSFVQGSQAFKAHGKSAGKPLAPVDDEGHGTHTASTAAGNLVPNVDVLGQAKGDAVGVAPRAYLAIYKVCSREGCAHSDILAGLDAAVADGVHVLSLSLGGPPRAFYSDPIATGAFAAIQKGIVVSCAGGNNGPNAQTVSNDAPWILTVGASSLDRSIRSTVRLGDGTEIFGETLYQPKDFAADQLPLVVPQSEDGRYCLSGSLDNLDVQGKIVLCERGGGSGTIEKGAVANAAGAVGVIIMNDETNAYSTTADPNLIPASLIPYAGGQKVIAYAKSNPKPTAAIAFMGTLIGRSIQSPVIASFSSRGPSVTTPGILKPDIIGPGLNILAAWPFRLGVNYTVRGPTFNVISGTSMSTPHLSGVAALIKSAQPDWSPAMIKSAIMTTSDAVNRQGKPIADERLKPANLFATGAGHVNPSKAVDPGLVYDILPEDYIPYLCGLNYTDDDVTVIVHKKISCADYEKIAEGELNYPSFTASLSFSKVTFNRTVMNVGEGSSTYKVEVDAPVGVSVVVAPQTLSFRTLKEKMSFTVTFSLLKSTAEGSYVEGQLRWVSAKHTVRSPISVYLGSKSAPLT